MKKLLISLLSFSLYTIYQTLNPPTAYAVVDPLSVSNNRFGIHIISSDVKESSDAASLVNTNGDWGYVTLLIERNNRDLNRWQTFFNDLRRRHLIPIVRIATEPSGDIWKKPELHEETAWAEFLDKLIWPTKNRYIVIYNEPNHASEWEEEIDPTGYAQVLDKTITALKFKNPDFFVLNAGFDTSAPNQPPRYMDSLTFMKKMEEAVPRIFDKLDGWVSHSYPNPNFQGSPDATGKSSVRGFEWELDTLQEEFKVQKKLPVFITETGWKHAEGKDYIKSLHSTQKVAEFYKKAFDEGWNKSNIVAVTPFVLNYQTHPFDHFSFKKNSNPDDVYPQFEVIKSMKKNRGRPIQENKAMPQKISVLKDNLVTSFEPNSSGDFTGSLVLGEEYTINLQVKNTGQSIWNDREEVRLIPLNGGENLGVLPISIPQNKKIEPGETYVFEFRLRSLEGGRQTLRFNLTQGSNEFDSAPFEINFDLKSPVILKIEASLKWKKDFGGDYILSVGKSILQIALTPQGNSRQIQTRYLLPDKDYSFTLEKPFYKPKTIAQKVSSGLNELDFGELQPDIASAILQPGELWKLLPFSN